MYERKKKEKCLDWCLLATTRITLCLFSSFAFVASRRHSFCFRLLPSFPTAIRQVSSSSLMLFIYSSNSDICSTKITALTLFDYEFRANASRQKCKWSIVAVKPSLVCLFETVVRAWPWNPGDLSCIAKGRGRCRCRGRGRIILSVWFGWEFEREKFRQAKLNSRRLNAWCVQRSAHKRIQPAMRHPWKSCLIEFWYPQRIEQWFPFGQ